MRGKPLPLAGYTTDGIRWDMPLDHRCAADIDQRTYQHTYGGHIAESGKYVRAGWGHWVGVTCNDGEGGLMRRPFFRHDYFDGVLVGKAVRAQDRNIMEESDLLQMGIWRVQKQHETQYGSTFEALPRWFGPSTRTWRVCGPALPSMRARWNRAYSDGWQAIGH